MLSVIVTTCVFLLLDGIWLGVVAKQLYANELGSLLKMSGGQMQPNWFAAVVVYFALILGITCFVIPKASGRCDLALMWGALFGFVTYATYDFTNLSVLANWPLRISVIDTLWGMVLCGLTSCITVFVIQKLN
jgi:uncharacterized membrane protein